MHGIRGRIPDGVIRSRAQRFCPGFYYDTARVWNFSAWRRTRAGRGQRAAGPPLPYCAGTPIRAATTNREAVCDRAFTVNCHGSATASTGHKSSSDCFARLRSRSRNPATCIRKSARLLRGACLFCSYMWPGQMPVRVLVQARDTSGRLTGAFTVNCHGSVTASTGE